MLNPLSLSVWVVFWIAMVSLQGLIGDLWRWINPWSGLAALVARITGRRAPLRYPRALGHWPGLVSFLPSRGSCWPIPAPTDPARLAQAWQAIGCVHMAGVCFSAAAWLLRAEGITLLMRSYARMGLLGRARGRLALGLSGWQVLARPMPSLGLAVLMLTLLGQRQLRRSERDLFVDGLAWTESVRISGPFRRDRA